MYQKTRNYKEVVYKMMNFEVRVWYFEKHSGAEALEEAETTDSDDDDVGLFSVFTLLNLHLLYYVLLNSPFLSGWRW